MGASDAGKSAFDAGEVPVTKTKLNGAPSRLPVTSRTSLLTVTVTLVFAGRSEIGQKSAVRVFEL
jgi:hypothetical protein